MLLNDNNNIKELQIKLDKTEYDCNRYKDRILENENHLEMNKNIIISLEKDILQYQDEIFRKEKLWKDEKQKYDMIISNNN